MQAVERLRNQGVGVASPIDLLAVGLSRRPADANQAEEMARTLLRNTGSILGLGELSLTDLQNAAGLDAYESLRVLALVEIGRRIAKASRGEVTEVNQPEDIHRLLEHLAKEKREHFVAVLLDAKNQILKVSTIHIGTLTQSLVGAREVFREAIREGASALVIAHNHPSGDATPSPEDLNITDKLVKVGEMLDIPILDHVIIGARGFFSFQQKGILRG